MTAKDKTDGSELGDVSIEIVGISPEIMATIDGLIGQDGYGANRGEVVSALIEKSLNREYHEAILQLIETAKVFDARIDELDFFNSADGPLIFGRALELTAAMLFAIEP